jgi:hypothetical protein
MMVLCDPGDGHSSIGSNAKTNRGEESLMFGGLLVSSLLSCSCKNAFRSGFSGFLREAARVSRLPFVAVPLQAYTLSPLRRVYTM